MELKEVKELTEDQKTQLKALVKSTRWNALKLSSRTVFLFFGSVVVVSVINGLFVQSQGFSLLCGGISGFFIGNSLVRSLRNEHDRIKEAVAKILSQ